MKDNIKNLVKLITENPTLKVLPMVNTEVVCSDDYSRYVSSIGKSRIDEVYFDDERVFFRSKGEDELIDEFAENIAIDNEDLEDDEIDEMAEREVEELKWEKVIVVNIDLPE